MTERKKIRPARALALCAAIVLVLGLASVAYASDVGGIQRTVQLWLHGDQTDAVLEIEHSENTSSYTLTYEDEEGNQRQQGGGGIAYDIFGRERPLTEEEIIEQLNAPEVDWTDEGAVWVYYLDQRLDISDKFDEDGVCYVQLKDGEGVLYMTVKRQGDHGFGYSTSHKSYPNPRRF